MKPLMIVGLAAILAVAAFAVTASQSSAGAPPDPYVGAWESIDIDGSYQTLSIGLGAARDPSGDPSGVPPDPMRPLASHQVVYFDHGATVCGGDQAIAIGWGVPPDPYEPNTLEAEVSGWCLKSHTAFDGVTMTLTYMPDGDYLMQEVAGGVIEWTRQAANMGPAVHPSPE